VPVVAVQVAVVLVAVVFDIAAEVVVVGTLVVAVKASPETIAEVVVNERGRLVWVLWVPAGPVRLVLVCSQRSYLRIE